MWDLLRVLLEPRRRVELVHHRPQRLVHRPSK
jgi:hypothetical protein